MPKSPNRIGKFYMSDSMLRHWEDFLPTMVNFVVVRAEFLYYKRALEVVAYSPLFDIIPTEETPPTYQIIADKNEHGVFITVERQHDNPS